tara:strand:+ start:200 stop:301 length:102 start_codon:yes stop_codon:yes gene_type:complete
MKIFNPHFFKFLGGFVAIVAISLLLFLLVGGQG